jgi:hypothetical protein
MARGHVIEYALDFARVPALARNAVAPTLPPNIVELMRIAAGSPEACEAAAANSGVPAAAAIEAARFYLQQTLFRPEADCYRILGIDPGTSRATARDHMRWLMEWLHPDRNRNSWDAVYAERVLKAWREVSAAQGGASQGAASHGAAIKLRQSPPNGSSRATTKMANIKAIRLPWIARPVRRRSPAMRGIIMCLAVPRTLMFIFVGTVGRCISSASNIRKSFRYQRQ